MAVQSEVLGYWEYIRTTHRDFFQSPDDQTSPKPTGSLEEHAGEFDFSENSIDYSGVLPRQGVPSQGTVP